MIKIEELMQDIAAKAVRRNACLPPQLALVATTSPELTVRLPGDSAPIVVPWVTAGWQPQPGDVVHVERVGATYGVSNRWVRTGVGAPTPVNVTAGGGPGNLYVGWLPGVGPGYTDGYIVEVRRNEVGYVWEVLQIVRADQRFAVVYGLFTDVSYQVRVRAFSEELGASEVSDIQTVTVSDSADMVPSQPSTPIRYWSGGGSILLRTSIPSSNFVFPVLGARFEYYRTVEGSATAKSVGGGVYGDYMFTSLQSPSTIRTRVAAINADGESSFSAWSGSLTVTQ